MLLHHLRTSPNTSTTLSSASLLNHTSTYRRPSVLTLLTRDLSSDSFFLSLVDFAYVNHSFIKCGHSRIGSGSCVTQIKVTSNPSWLNPKLALRMALLHGSHYRFSHNSG